MLGTGQGNDLQCLRVTKWLETAMKENPSTTWLLNDLVRDVRRLQRDYRGAADLYREIVTRSERPLLAYNNLAWLLASLHQVYGTKASGRGHIEVTEPMHLARGMA